MTNLNHLVPKVIRKLLRKWDKEGYSTFSINNGCCDTFAQEILDIMKHGDIFWGEDFPEKFIRGYNDGWGTHCFYCLNGVYYDSECPNGVSSPDFLPFYKRQRGE